MVSPVHAQDRPWMPGSERILPNIIGIQVLVSDRVTGKCLNNVRAIKNRVELLLVQSGIKVGDCIGSAAARLLVLASSPIAVPEIFFRRICLGEFRVSMRAREERHLIGR